ncbi:hypothetical protein GQ464_010635 [Rhodocaloribacter litoris]|uniref:hypothetical protein n=1 Tax=Rhodocaloribacter litoris TaxID=2558931 RepID=UPI001E646B18|nr:hypothetical protein [Rhodocaloribacter litoris]QXD13917.1 hypothetical protein GQ464_010635 [Rhodocaloribacter litoris]GIV58061.1 MAG: hypothetical protein KatS3mg042_0974 [Rhodothermaceae bacterium]
MEPSTPPGERTAPRPAQERGRLALTVDALARQAGALTGLTRRLALATLAAGAWLWGLAAYPFTFDAVWAWVLAGLGLVFLLAPGVLLWLFDAGLRELTALPARLARTLDTGRTRTADLYATATGTGARGRWWLWRLVKGVLDLRTLVLDARGLLVQYAALARLLNPWMLAIAVTATVAGAVLIALAALTLLFVALF